MTQPIQSFRSYAAIVPETSWGTLAAPSTADHFLEGYSAIKNSTEYDEIRDEGYRSLGSKTFAYYHGFAMSKLGFDILPYPKNLGHFLMGVMGADSVSGVDPYTHAMTVLNTGLPKSYTVCDFDATISNWRRYAGSFIESLTFTYASTGALKCAVSMVGKREDTSGAVVTPVFATDTTFLPFQNVLTFNGSGSDKLIGMSLKLSRKYEEVFGSGGTQDLTGAGVGPLEVTGTLTFAPSDAGEYLAYFNNSQPAVDLTFTNGVNVLTFHMSTCALHKATQFNRDNPNVKLSAAFDGIYNATDGGPIKVTLINHKSGAY